MDMVKRGILVLLMLVLAAPVFAGEATQFWFCEMNDDTTEEQVKAMAAEWLEAAKKLKGGKNLELSVMFPVAVNATGEYDVVIMVKTPTFAEWGQLWDSYSSTPEVADMEAEHNEHVVCPDSSLWETIEVE